MGGIAAVGIAFILRGAGGGTRGTQAAQGTLGVYWQPGRIGAPMLAPDTPQPDPPDPPAPATSGLGS